MFTLIFKVMKEKEITSIEIEIDNEEKAAIIAAILAEIETEACDSDENE
ncbi:MAG: hypothetical protein OHK0038_20560 [Flammeovirgaceae bacterium]